MYLRAAAPALALLALMGLGPTEVQAQPSPDSVVPYYRGFAFGGIARQGGFQFDGADVVQDFYENNVGPQPFVRAAGTLSADGTNLFFDTWAASTGFYAARSYASMTVQNANPAHDYYVISGHGTATTVRFFTPQAASARAVFTWHVTGTGDASGRPDRWADGRVDFYATTDTGRSWFDLFNGGFQNTLFEYGQGTYTYTLPTAPLGTPIQLYFWTSAFTQINAGTLQAGASDTLTANFSNTIVLDSVALFDDQGQAISSWSLVDEETGITLFDETGRLVPVGALPAIPEPGTWALWLVGLATLGYRWGRQHRAASASGARLSGA